jgi:hypothetical protein
MLENGFAQLDLVSSGVPSSHAVFPHSVARATSLQLSLRRRMAASTRVPVADDAWQESLE